MRNEELKYFAYCRKSSEDSKKQVASIGDQTNTVMAMVERETLNLVYPPFTEEKSAKQPGRLVFNEMLNRIEKGEANAIVCWAINRLIRNPVDEGRLRWMLQKGVIRVIKTATREYTPDDAGLLMGVEGGQATDYVIRLSKDTKRGLYGKVRNGWRPSPAPIGYLNVGEVGDKTIIADPEKFNLVRQMWDLFLTGAYPVSKIRDMAINKWGLRTLVRRKLGGRPLSMSHMYNTFNDPFYYGYFWWNDEETGIRTLVKGKHPPMITEKEFMRAQILLGGHGHAQPHTREFAFTGFGTLRRVWFDDNRRREKSDYLYLL
ncbi:MAG: recombinase family protein [Parcubacteria group bacterium]|nr:recombinase family protein [Parcubacteria group bacterium]